MTSCHKISGLLVTLGVAACQGEFTRKPPASSFVERPGVSVVGRQASGQLDFGSIADTSTEVTVSIPLDGVSSADLLRVSGFLFSGPKERTSGGKDSVTVTAASSRVRAMVEILNMLRPPPAGPSRPAVTLRGRGDVSNYLARNFSAGFYGTPLPSEILVSLPEDALPGEIQAALQMALRSQSHLFVYPLYDSLEADAEFLGFNVIGQERPERTSSDPDMVPLTEEPITQIVPLRHGTSAVTLARQLKPFADPDVAVASGDPNVVLLTGPGARIHRIVEVIATLQHPHADSRVIRYVHLANLDARKTALFLDTLAGIKIDPVKQGLPSIRERIQTWQVKADGDARTNTLIFAGPGARLEGIEAALQRLDAAQP